MEEVGRSYEPLFIVTQMMNAFACLKFNLIYKLFDMI
jgi:hypothetical protein